MTSGDCQVVTLWLSLQLCPVDSGDCQQKPWILWWKSPLHAGVAALTGGWPIPRHLSGLVGKYNDAFICDDGDHKRPVLLMYSNDTDCDSRTR